MDFTPITTALDVSTLMAALAAVAALLILPNVARWGYDKVIFWFRDSANDEAYDYDDETYSTDRDEQGVISEAYGTRYRED